MPHCHVHLFWGISNEQRLSPGNALTERDSNGLGLSERVDFRDASVPKQNALKRILELIESRKAVMD
jgi:hypothetical protein